MAEQKEYDPDIIGTGGARKASEQLRNRGRQIDEAVDAATGEPTKKEEKKEREPMSRELMRRLADLLRGKKE